MNLCFYIGNQREAILEGFEQLARDLPTSSWLFVRPLILTGNNSFPGCGLNEPDWYAWRKSPLRLLRMAKFLLEVRGMIIRCKVERVFLYGIPNPWTFGLRLLLLASRAKLVLYVHDPKLHEGENMKKRALNRLYELAIMKSAAAVVVSYLGGKRDLVSRGFDNSKIHVVPLPMLDSMGIASGSPEPSDLLFFGRLEPYKGIDLLEKVLVLLAERGHQLRTIVVGRGPLEEQVAAMCGRVPGTLHIMDYVPNERLALLVASTRVLILPYRDATGTQTIQIANHHGTPVVGTAVGCFPEYIEDGCNGRVVPGGDASAFADAVEALLGEDRQTVALRCKAHAAAHHDPAVFARAIHRIVSGIGTGQ